MLKTSTLTLTFAILLWGGAAQARQNPMPPSSGIVVHLFGQNSVASHILPTGETKTTQGGDAANAAPSTQSILHQMFVTGDPNQKPGAAFAKGKAATPLAN
jgi:hypothetical protein